MKVIVDYTGSSRKKLDLETDVKNKWSKNSFEENSLCSEGEMSVVRADPSSTPAAGIS